MNRQLVHFMVGHIAGCSRAYEWSNSRSIDAVTCKTCCKYIIKNKLVRRESFSESPTFLCDVVKGRSGPTLEFKCPCCGKVHMHGIGDGERVSHCPFFESYYVKAKT